MSCPWALPLRRRSDCPGEEALDKASYVGLHWPCRAGALAPRQFLKNHTTSPSRMSTLGRHARGSRNLLLVLIGESGRRRACFSRAVRRATQTGDAAAAHKARLMSERAPDGDAEVHAAASRRPAAELGLNTLATRETWTPCHPLRPVAHVIGQDRLGSKRVRAILSVAGVNQTSHQGSIAAVCQELA